MEWKAQEHAILKRRDDTMWIAFEESELLRKDSFTKAPVEAARLRQDAKKIRAPLSRHLRTWRNVAYLGAPVKPNGGEEGLARGGGYPAVRMAHAERAPPAVDRTLKESTACTASNGLPTG